MMGSVTTSTFLTPRSARSHPTSRVTPTPKRIAAAAISKALSFMLAFDNIQQVSSGAGVGPLRPRRAGVGLRVARPHDRAGSCVERVHDFRRAKRVDPSHVDDDAPQPKRVPGMRVAHLVDVR